MLQPLEQVRVVDELFLVQLDPEEAQRKDREGESSFHLSHYKSNEVDDNSKPLIQ